MDPTTQSFFKKLGQLAGKIERECNQYRSRLETTEDRDDCPAEAKKAISDLRRDVKALESPLQTLHEQQRKEIQKLQDISTALDSFVNTTLPKKFSELEQHLSQYGYKTYEETQKNRAECSKLASLSKMEGAVENAIVAKPKTPPVTKPPQDPNRTPRLEESGISMDTLQYLNSLHKNKPVPYRPAHEKPNWENLPKEFQHDGIICSPGLFQCTNPDQSYCADLHSALASPAVHAPVHKANSFPVTGQTGSSSVAKQLLSKYPETSQPESPVLHTPGIKQIMSNPYRRYNHNSAVPREISKQHVNVSLFQTEEAKDTNSSKKDTNSSNHTPKVPDFTACYDDGEPIEPQLTYSLEALSEMTGVYQIHSPKKPLPFISKPFVNQSVANSNKENATPPEPELLTNRISRVKIQEESKPKNEFETKQFVCDDMPPSPKLLGNYDFLK